MKNKSESVSVIIPVYNGESYLGEAISSILNQTLPVGEIIVVDDGSTDRTRAVAETFGNRVTCIHQNHTGLASARNRGIELARGDYFAHLDADDLWMPRKIESQLREFAAHPELEIAGGLMQNFFSPEIREEERPHINCPPNPLPGFSASVLLVKRRAFFKVGFYSTRWQFGCDLDWFVRARETGLKEVLIKKVLARRRLHHANSGILLKHRGVERIRILQESLARRRKTAGS